MAINIGNYGKTSTYMNFADHMMENLTRMIRENDKARMKENNLEPIRYMASEDGTCKIQVCPEPITFLKSITKEETTQKRNEAFENLRKSLPQIQVERPEKNRWINTTSNGINLRLGNMDSDSGLQNPAVLGDDCVHGVVVGRTGAGKSVLINNIILNLATEYAPWELDLYLVDMKKVELSRYMATDENGHYLTPHVSACGATSEVRYVVSMIQYLSDCMKARQALFAALGVQKIKDFREKYDLVLPRILLLVDEFQQMFLEASGAERRVLDECITAITKLGRATGVHLLFASQEMSGALGAKELANFKLRIALPCDAAISEQILGNSAAAKLDKKGITLINKKGGSKEEDNIRYATPFVNDKAENEGELSEFSRYLSGIHLLGEACKFTKVQKFYQEDVQDKIEKIEKIRKNPQIEGQIHQALESSPSLIDAMVLGTSVVYSNRKNDFESFFLERGKKRNIGILCAKDGDIVNVLKTLVENFRCSSGKYQHRVVYESEILRAAYPDLIEELQTGQNSTAKEVNYQDLKGSQENKILWNLDYTKDKAALVNDFFISYFQDFSEESLKKIVGNLIKNRLNQDDFDVNVIKRERFMIFSQNLLLRIQYENANAIVDPIIKELQRTYMELNQEIMKIFADLEETAKQLNMYKEDKSEEAKKKCKELSKEKENLEKKGKGRLEEAGYTLMLIVNIQKFNSASTQQQEDCVTAMDILQNSIRAGKYAGPVSVCWIIGVENLDKSEERVLSNIMETCTSQNELYILAGATDENMETAYRCCNYMFLNLPDEKLYVRYKMNFTKKSDDNKTIDFKIINYNQERSYKQLAFTCAVKEAPKLNFEEIEV